MPSPRLLFRSVRRQGARIARSPQDGALFLFADPAASFAGDPAKPHQQQITELKQNLAYTVGQRTGRSG